MTIRTRARGVAGGGTIAPVSVSRRRPYLGVAPLVGGDAFEGGRPIGIPLDLARAVIEGDRVALELEVGEAARVLLVGQLQHGLSHVRRLATGGTDSPRTIGTCRRCRTDLVGALMAVPQLRYLSAAELARCLPGVETRIDLAAQALSALGRGAAEMPPKIGVHPRPGRIAPRHAGVAA